MSDMESAIRRIAAAVWDNGYEAALRNERTINTDNWIQNPYKDREYVPSSLCDGCDEDGHALTCVGGGMLCSECDGTDLPPAASNPQQPSNGESQ